MTDSSPRERRGERTRQAILDTALALIIEKGLNKLSLREIARRVDYSPAGLYEYFGSKDEIIEAVVAEAHVSFFNHLNRTSKALSEEAYLAELGIAYIDFANLYPDKFMLMFTQYQHTPIGDLSTFAPDAESNAYGLLLEGVKRALGAGVIQAREKYELVDITYSLWAIVHGMAMLQATHLRQFEWDFPNTNRQALETFIAGLK